jgi:hypothetical protein
MVWRYKENLDINNYKKEKGKQKTKKRNLIKIY